jgi:hypothetical protein
MSSTLEWIVDFRHTAGPVIDQGIRPTCLSCAVSAAHHYIRGVAKSIEYLHYGSRKLPTGYGSINSVQIVLANDGQPNESGWPYDPTLDESTLSPIPQGPLPQPFDHADLVVDSAPSRAALIRHLQADQLPVIGLRTTPGLMTLRGGVLTEPGPHGDGHAVLMVGAAKYTGPDLGMLHPNDQLMCIQNSWGTSWGVNGYGLIGPRAWDDMAHVALRLVAT